ncbi:MULTISPECIES: N-acetylglucosamine-specific PTS transporter subunit IIBC [Sphingobium]|jgi:PTS system N-acetylglucosamine-specific IIC component|uniref:PTS N-acetyl-D-glucosamine transporter n=2 Tax=Sphingobium yanoikuyae TaxID=13690 RepID=A0A0J9D5X6_SPHYA|nr:MULTISPECIES: N-acetylglucosamine-specific PTS transporter subunit IIBC [Sphingobium]ATP19503.1 PTS N-acetyl-D-glucosamine transporter [Sphingobium yanoikuyae]KMW32569.1 PTS N-acetyl-D-glucosamine transporter [Sphingobium yanoikuyae]TKV44487.1 PTS N-acetyl-D-glucosamine transporter [Sphingobium sp. MP9-4]
MSFRPANLLARLQPLGRALMLPIAVLPIAALLLRLGQPDMLAIPFVAAAGDAIFSNLGLLFAAGVAVGLARENHGAASLAGVIAYLVTTEGAKVLLVLPPDVAEAAQAAWRAKEIAKVSVPAGILSGIVAGLLYNRFSDIKLPDYLAFFAGRRFVPIVAGLAGLFGALMFGLGFPWIEAGIDRLSQWVVAAGPLGLFVYGLLNRLLLITGLHHIINNVAWFLLGDFHGATGDIKRFFAGDPTAGGFMSGFFPVMMFGLPAACLAMYRTALPDRRKRVGGLLLSLALTSFLTGVTEPIEFSFIFLAPILYVVHAVLTGLSMVVMDALGVKLGFGFSAGLFDYLMNYGLATKPLMLIPVGLVYFAVYYATFSWCIRRFNLKTPGREDEAAAAVDMPNVAGARGPAMVAALGGKSNVRSVDACTTRLRLVLGDSAIADEARLRALGARGVVRLRDGGFQVVLGPIADQVAAEIRSALAGHDPAPIAGTSDLVALLKGAGVRAVEPRGTRLLVRVDRPAAVDAAALRGAGVKAWVLPASADGWLHLILGDQVQPLAEALRAA